MLHPGVLIVQSVSSFMLMMNRRREKFRKNNLKIDEFSTYHGIFNLNRTKIN